MELTNLLVQPIALLGRLLSPRVLFTGKDIRDLIQKLALPVADLLWMHSVFRGNLGDLPVTLNSLGGCLELEILSSPCTFSHDFLLLLPRSHQAHA